MGHTKATNDSAVLVDLVYELLDAHDDTAHLAQADGCEAGDRAWEAHLDYLRGLQRVGREVLARTDRDD